MQPKMLEVKQRETTYVIEIDEDFAGALLEICNIVGGESSGVRGKFDTLRVLLQKEGIVRTSIRDKYIVQLTSNSLFFVLR